MEVFTKENGSENKDMDSEFSSGHKGRNMKVIGKEISSMAMEHSVFQTATFIKEIG